MLDTRTAKIYLAEDFYVRADILPEARQSVDDARENLKAAVETCGNGQKPILINLCGCQPLEPEARRHYSGEVLVDHFEALAMLVDISPFGQFMANLYLQIAKPQIPSRLFTDEKSAVDWLRKQVSGHRE